jgi:hypothetical protein
MLDHTTLAPPHRSLTSSAAVCLVACGANADRNEVSAGTTSGGSGGASTGGRTCPPPPPPSATLPNTPGCFENNMGAGWIAVPCLCDLWLDNTTPGPATANITLAVPTPDQVPTLTGGLDVEVAFEDPDASWYARWATQAGNGVAFLVTSAAGKTTVRMGEAKVTLAPVPSPRARPERRPYRSCRR